MSKDVVKSMRPTFCHFIDRSIEASDDECLTDAIYVYETFNHNPDVFDDNELVSDVDKIAECKTHREFQKKLGEFATKLRELVATS